MKCVGSTDIGKLRPINQDAYAIEQSDDLALIMVCDGMGGAKAGEVASAIALESMKQSFRRNPPQNLSSKGLSLWLENAILKANYEVHQAAQHPSTAGMGTTLVAALMAKDAMVGANIGDSRLYLLDKHQSLIQISEDHSLIQEMINQGQLSPEQAKLHPQRAVLTHVLGILERPRIDLFGLAADAQCILICSDGIHNMISDEEMASILTKSIPLEHKVERLMQAANNAGGIDNLTVVVAERSA